MAEKAWTDAQIEEFEAAREAGLGAPAWAVNFVWSPDGGYRFMDPDEVKATDEAAKTAAKAATDRAVLIEKLRAKGQAAPPPAPRVVG